MDTKTLKLKIEKAIKAVDKAEQISQELAHKSIKRYYEDAIKKIDSNVELDGSDFSKLSAGTRMMMEGGSVDSREDPYKIYDDMWDLEKFVGDEYYKKF